jgi:DNA-directed RNA polymerase specialized sigma24 family protein
MMLYLWLNKRRGNIAQKQKIITMSKINFSSEVSKLQSVLLSFAFKLTRNKEESKDLYQETAYRALVNKDKFREGKKEYHSRFYR